LPGTYLGETIGTIAPPIIIVSKLTVIVQTHTHTTTTVPLSLQQTSTVCQTLSTFAAATGGHSSNSSYKCN